MSYAGALLPVAALPLLWLLVSVHREQLGLGRLSTRGTFVVAHTVFQALLLAVTEILSIGRHITPSSLAIAWSVLVLAMCALALSSVGIDGLRARARLASRKSLLRHVRAWPLEVPLGLSVLGLILGVLAVIGWLYPPNNTDSLVYHLARVAHWIQESSVSHFATHWTAQIELAPLHEFNMLHVQLLAGTDRLDGFVQLLSYVVCVVAASEIARLLGATLTTQVSAAIIAAVIPSALLESTSTQNNLFGAAIAMGVILIPLAWIPLGAWPAPAAILGVGLGLSVIAKGTVLLLMMPAVCLLAAYVVWLERRSSSWPVVFRRSVRVGLVVATTALLMAGPFLRRNVDVFGTFAGPISQWTVSDELRFQPFAANVVRSVAANFRVGDGESGVETWLAKIVLGGLRSVHDVFGAAQDDLRFAIEDSADAFAVGDYTVTSRFEEFGANPWHVLLLTVSGGVLLSRAVRRRPGSLAPALLTIGLAIGFVAFAGSSKWSVYVTRYALPVLVMWAVVIALALSGFGRVTRGAIIGLLIVASVPQLIDNWPRSLLHPRYHFASSLDAYFVGRALTEPEAAGEFKNVIEAIVASGCKRVGLTNLVLLEYPLWAGLQHAGWDGRIEHVDVPNESRVLETVDFEPCAIVRQTVVPPFEPRVGFDETAYGSLSLALENRGTE